MTDLEFKVTPIAGGFTSAEHRQSRVLWTNTYQVRSYSGQGLVCWQLEGGSRSDPVFIYEDNEGEASQAVKHLTEAFTLYYGEDPQAPLSCIRKWVHSRAASLCRLNTSSVVCTVSRGVAPSNAEMLEAWTRRREAGHPIDADLIRFARNEDGTARQGCGFSDAALEEAVQRAKGNTLVVSQRSLLGQLETPDTQDPKDKPQPASTGQPPQVLHAGGRAASTPVPPLHLIPTEALVRLAERFELGIKRKGDLAWNALSKNQEVLLDVDFAIDRIGHLCLHALKLRDKLLAGNWDGIRDDDDASAIMWAGCYLSCVTAALLAQSVEQSQKATSDARSHQSYSGQVATQ